MAPSSTSDRMHPALFGDPEQADITGLVEIVEIGEVGGELVAFFLEGGGETDSGN